MSLPMLSKLVLSTEETKPWLTLKAAKPPLSYHAAAEHGDPS